MNSNFSESQFFTYNLDEKTNVNNILSQLTTLKDQFVKLINILIEKVQSSFDEIELNYRLYYYKNILNETTRKELERIINFTTSAIECMKTTQGLISNDHKDEKQLLYQVGCQNICYSLVCYKEQNIIIGGVDNLIYIWDQKNLELISPIILSVHTGWVTGIVTCTIEPIFISCGWKRDNSIVLWKYIKNKWNPMQRLLEHTGAITDIKLTKNEDQLITTSQDKSIKIWALEKILCQLKCIQTIYQQHFSAYVALTSNQQFMAAGGQETYFLVFNFDRSQVKWSKYQKVSSRGTVRRLHFVNDSYQLFCQQLQPGRIIIFEMNSSNQLFEQKQEINLKQSDDYYLLFPILQIDNMFYLKNSTYIYEIALSEKGLFQVNSITYGHYTSGCPDLAGKLIIMGSIHNRSIDVFIQR